MADVEFCQRQMYGECYSPPMPAEYCDNEAEPDSDFCAYHTAPDLWDDDENRRDDDLYYDAMDGLL